MKGERKAIGRQRMENCYNYIIISKIKKEKGYVEWAGLAFALLAFPPA